MGNRNIIKNAVKAGMKAVGDIKVDITYHVAVFGAKDSKGIRAVTYTDHTIEATIVSYQNLERFKDGGLLAPGDRLVIMENRFFTALSVTPKKTDQITLDDGNKYKIINPRLDPSNNVYFFQTRQV